MPSSVDPMLPTFVKLLFSDPQWLFDPKWDGYALRYRQRHGAIVFNAFDLLHFDGRDISQYPLAARKAAVVARGSQNSPEKE